MRKRVEFGLFLVVVVVVSLLVWGFVQVNDQSNLSLGLKGGYDAGYIQGLMNNILGFSIPGSN